MALMIALAVVLDLISKSLPLPKMPFGGSISLKMLPLVVFALRHGLWRGSVAGALYGVVELATNPFLIHPAQVLLDYPLAHAALGLAGWGSPVQRQATGSLEPLRLNWSAWARIGLGVAIAGATRWVFHWVSGVVFFAEYAPQGQPVWLYSALYNASYILPEVVLCMVVLVLSRRVLAL